MANSYEEKVPQFEALGELKVREMVDDGTYAHRNLRWAQKWLRDKDLENAAREYLRREIKAAEQRAAEEARVRRERINLWLAVGGLVITAGGLLVTILSGS